MHYAFAQSSLGVSQANDGARTNLISRHAARIGNGVSLSHECSGFSGWLSRH
jgi:hypothetical protein